MIQVRAKRAGLFRSGEATQPKGFNVVKSTWNLIIGMCVGAVAGFVFGQAIGGKSGTPLKAAVAAETPTNKPRGDEQIYKVIVGGAPVKGDSDAKVTIVEWSDFQCPFCGRVMPTLKQVEETYGKEVRIAFKQNPLPMHSDAPFAARAALAAQKQDKFWQMHDKLFAANNSHQPDSLKKEKVLQMARDLGLDLTQFERDIASPEMADVLRSDQAQALRLGANGTPHFFINGVRISGAQPFEEFKKVIDAQMKRADAVLATGVSRKDLYDTLIRDGLTQQPAPPSQPPQAPAPTARNVEPGEGSPALGAKNAKITIVEWSDFQCPFCSRVEPALKQVMDTYKGDVRLVWRNEPLPFHPNAMPAAKAAMAAARQGKFWEMHDLMFSHQGDLSDAKYEEWARQVGLNVDRWKKDKESPEIAAAITKDSSYGQSVGADGTPAFFVNGKFISGAMPFDSFKTVIDEQLKKADELLKKGTAKEKLYEALVAENVKAAPAPAAGGAADSGEPVKVEVGNAPALGPKNAPVTIVVFSDFQCPFCSRVEPALQQVRTEYKDKVRIAWKNQPLPFHANAMPAAEAAMAAYEQGNDKFWAMHDKFFANQGSLSPAFYDQTARELGLDLDKFHASIEAHRAMQTIQADMAAGAAIGAGGTPTSFINGKKIVGALPFESFKQIIDAELAAKVAHQ